MDILIGRSGTQPFPLTEESISKQHALFKMEEQSGVMTLRDNNSTNGTYVKTQDGSFKRINGTIKVGLGTVVRVGAVQAFTIKDLLKSPKPATPKEQPVNINKLRNVYETYNSNKMSLESQTSNIMMLRLGAMSVSGILVNVIAMILPQDMFEEEIMNQVAKGTIHVVGTILALMLAWIIVGIKNKNLIRRKDMNDRYFKANYCCPKCGFHFGNHIYSNILAEGQCPNKNCRCKFVGD